MSWPTEFKEVEVTRGRWKLTWEYIGEGSGGEYDPRNPQDVPRLRASLEYLEPKKSRQGTDRREKGEYVAVDNGSYCTMASTTTPRDQLVASARALLTQFGITLPSFSKRAMEMWTWTEYDCPKPEGPRTFVGKLSASARVIGSTQPIQAKDEDEARTLIEAVSPGDILWEYDGLEDGEGFEIEEIREVT